LADNFVVFFALIKCARAIFQISDKSQTMYNKLDRMQFYTAI